MQRGLLWSRSESLCQLPVTLLRGDERRCRQPKLAAASMLTLLSFSFGAPMNTTDDCGGCSSTASASAASKCEPGWRGADCSLKACAATKLGDDGAGECCGHGLCPSDGTCECADGYGPLNPGTAPRRTTAAAAQSAADRRRRARVLRHVDGQVSCLPGWAGADCARALCPNACSGHGKCASTAHLALRVRGGVAATTRDGGVHRRPLGARRVHRRAVPLPRRVHRGGTASSPLRRRPLVPRPLRPEPVGRAADVRVPPARRDQRARARRARRARTTARASTARRARATPAGR